MTLLATWLRKAGTDSQLVVASDSRLSFGARWNCCPKIFPLSRNDSVLAFCGDTSLAYPVLIQLVNAVDNYGKAHSREIDLVELKTHFVRVTEAMRSSLTDLPLGNHGISTTGFTVMLAGYSWRTKAFRAWAISYSRQQHAFHHRTLAVDSRASGGSKRYAFLGDAVAQARARLHAKLRQHDKTLPALDMEPLEVLTEMSEDPHLHSIGGPPQLVKIYPYANVLPINVLWPRGAPQAVCHFGRPLLGYEGSQYACLDLDSLELLSPHAANQRLRPELADEDGG